LKSIGYTKVFADDEAVGYGYEGGDDKLCLKLAKDVTIPGEGFHLAFSAKERNQVHEFHAAALRHGGRCNGAPGPRSEYGNSYYAAFVLIPTGIESKRSSTELPNSRAAKDCNGSVSACRGTAVFSTWQRAMLA